METKVLEAKKYQEICDILMSNANEIIETVKNLIPFMKIEDDKHFNDIVLNGIQDGLNMFDDFKKNDYTIPTDNKIALTLIDYAQRIKRKTETYFYKSVEALGELLLSLSAINENSVKQYIMESYIKDARKKSRIALKQAKKYRLI